MTKKDRLTPFFCCALGEQRSPMIASMVPDSELIDGGYIGMANWLEQLANEKTRISDLQTFYFGGFIFLIVNENDKRDTRFSTALNLVTDLLVKAGIAHGEFDVPELIVKIKTKELDQYL